MCGRSREGFAADRQQRQLAQVSQLGDASQIQSRHSAILDLISLFQQPGRMIFWKRWSHGLGWVRWDISKCKTIVWPKYRLKWHSFRSSITSTSATTRSLLSSRQALSTSQWPLSLTLVWKTIASSLFKTEPFKVFLYCNNNAFVIVS